MDVKFYNYVIGLSLISSPALASSSWSDNLRWSLDFSSRVQHQMRADRTAYIQAWGLDSHKVFQDNQGDWGTLVTQVYLTRIDNLSPHPGFFADEHDWELVYRIFNFNFTRWSRQFANIKVGHIELPFGLEHTINTNGDLRDYNHGRNLGPKADWGIGLNNQYQQWEYEVTLTTGGGQSLDRGDDSYILAARAGTNRDENLVLGVSAYKAELSELERERFAVDLQYYWGLYGFMAELAAGSKGNIDQLDALLELNWRNMDESWLLYSQWQLFTEERAGDEQQLHKLVAGLKYTPDQYWDMSANLHQDIESLRGAKQETRLALQLRYRF